MGRYILLAIVAISVFGIAPYSSFFAESSLASSLNKGQNKGIFDEIAETAEKVGDIDEKAEDIRRAGEEFVDDVKERKE